MESLEWNLDELFESSEAFYAEIDKTKLLLEDIKKYEKIEMNASVLEEMLNEKWKIKEMSNNILVYGSLRYYKNINDEESIKLKKDAEEFNSEVNTKLMFIDRMILSLGIDKVLLFVDENPKLETYRFSLCNLFRLKEHIMSNEINEKIKNNNINISEEVSRYNNILRDIKYGYINIDGEDILLTSSNLAKYLSSRDRDVRKQAYSIVGEANQKELDGFADIINKIYGYRIENANLEEYDSVLKKVLYEENINSRIINELIKTVNNNLNLAHEYLKIKASLLGVDEAYLYDFNVPLDSNLRIEYSLDEAKNIILNALSVLGKEYIDVVKLLFDGHIDAVIDENKHQSITFSWNTYSFMNYRGSYVDLKNMIHEIGHIVNYYLSQKKQPFMYEDSTIFVGETASIINEILLNRYLRKNARSKEEEIFYLSKEIENYFTTVFKQTMYTEFEDDLYNNKRNMKLTKEVLSEKYGNIIRKYYGNIKYEEVDNNGWCRLGHLYRHSYYPYKYATGLLMASAVCDSLIDKKKLEIADYINFLSAGSSMYSLDLLKLLNINLINTDVMQSGFNVMAEDIEELKKVLYNK